MRQKPPASSKRGDVKDWSGGKPTPRRPEEKQPARGRRGWYDYPRQGRCESCGARGPRQAHHVVRETDVERYAPEKLHDVRNRMLLGWYCGCHSGQHNFGVRDTRIPLAKISPAAWEFAREVLGEELAESYFKRRYRDD